MSTLVNLLLAAAISLLGGEIQQQKQKTSNLEFLQCQQNIEQVATYYNIYDDTKFKQNEI